MLNGIAVHSIAAPVHSAAVVHLLHETILPFPEKSLRQTGCEGRYESHQRPRHRHDGIEKSPRDGDGVDTGFRCRYEERRGRTSARSLLSEGSRRRQDATGTKRDRDPQKGRLENRLEAAAAQVPHDVIGGQEHLEQSGDQDPEEDVGGGVEKDREDFGKEC